MQVGVRGLCNGLSEQAPQLIGGHIPEIEPHRITTETFNGLLLTFRLVQFQQQLHEIARKIARVFAQIMRTPLRRIGNGVALNAHQILPETVVSAKNFVGPVAGIDHLVVILLHQLRQ